MYFRVFLFLFLCRCFLTVLWGFILFVRTRDEKTEKYRLSVWGKIKRIVIRRLAWIGFPTGGALVMWVIGDGERQGERGKVSVFFFLICWEPRASHAGS